MYKWQSIILKQSDSVGTAIAVLDKEALRIVMVADTQGKLLGTITDGDIRRALLKQLGMDALLEKIMCKHPVTALSESSQDSILTMMRQKGILQVPIVDKANKIVGLETLQHLIKEKKFENPVFLMAGGFGKRLMPLTEDTPKPLLKIGGKPILETIITQLVAAGFCNFYISTHYKAEMIEEYFGDGSKWGGEITYIYEPEPLGTAGALGLLAHCVLPDLPLLMMNGDLLTKVDFRELLKFHYRQSGIATMCVREYDLQVPYGVVDTKEYHVKSIVEKPVHKFFVNAGIYVLDPELVKQVDGSKYLDMPTLLNGQLSSGMQVNSFPLHEYWLDIGHIEQFKQAQIDVSRFNL